jgi:hypothetical protein
MSCCCSARSPRPEARDGASGTLDAAVRAAVSLAREHLARRDRVALVDFGGTLHWLEPAFGTTQLYRIIEALLASEIALSYAWRAVESIPQRVLPPAALLLAVSPLLDERSIRLIIDLRRRNRECRGPKQAEVLPDDAARPLGTPPPSVRDGPNDTARCDSEAPPRPVHLAGDDLDLVLDRLVVLVELAEPAPPWWWSRSARPASPARTLSRHLGRPPRPTVDPRETRLRSSPSTEGPPEPEAVDEST